jgi:ATPase
MQNVKGCWSILDQYFDVDTMSIHIKENTPMLKKNGSPVWRKSQVWKEVLTKDFVKNLIDDIFQEIETREDSVLEINRNLSKVVQLWPYRIVIVYPPLSDGLEITVVKPIKKLSLDDYNLDKEVLDWFKDSAKWILVSGPPWSGKTTFAQALVELYEWEDNIVKTVESPRDLMVPESVVQYSFTYWSHDEVRDILLLSRPDYTVYDEVRNKPDFELYKDMRLTWIGLIGVIHATRPVDSIQRFLWTIEMWIIPQVLDTVIFIDKWEIKEILHLNLTVKVPAGMQSEDLARPVIEVSSFFDKQIVFEIYTFGEQIVVMPLWEEITTKNKPSKMAEYAKVAIDHQLQEIMPCSFISKVKWDTVYLFVPKSEKWAIIWKAGKNIQALESEIWLRIDLETFDELPLLDTEVRVEKNNNSVVLYFPKHFIEKNIYIMIGKDLLHTQTNDHAQVIIKNKTYVKAILSKWFVLVDYDQI